MNAGLLAPSLESLTPSLTRSLGQISGIDVQPCILRSSALLYEVDVRLPDGGELPLMLKFFAAGADGDLSVRPQVVADPVREAQVYRHLLQPEGVSSPQLYDVEIDALNSWSWILLERVDGRPLWQCGELAVWARAAEWLADLHAEFPGRRAEALVSGLIEVDGDHLDLWMARAHSLGPGRLGPESKAGIEALGERHRQVVALLRQLPRTLLHGEFFPSNVLWRAGPSGEQNTRVCPLDWEGAGLGPCLLDLAALTAGAWPSGDRRAIEDAYQQRARANGLWSDDLPAFRAALGAARIQVAVQQAGWAPEWTAPAEHRHDWIREAVDLLSELEP